MPLAMQTGTRVPSAPASVRQEGPRGPAGRGHACYHQYCDVNRTNYTTEYKYNNRRDATENIRVQNT